MTESVDFRNTWRNEKFDLKAILKITLKLYLLTLFISKFAVFCKEEVVPLSHCLGYSKCSEY